MSLLGKILVAFNLLAVLLFLYLVAVDWGVRQTWAYAANRWDLALDGLPLDSEERGPEGDRLIDRVSDQTLQDMFKGAGPAPSDKTQLGEVRRVRDKLRQEIESQPDDAKKKERLAAVLAPLARTGFERDTLRQQIADPNAQVSQLMSPQGPFEQAFNTVLTPAGSVEPADRRRAIAHLLLNLANPDPKANDYQRVLVIVGYTAFAYEADHQAIAWRDMSHRVQLALAEEQAAFEKDYQRILSELYLAAENLVAEQKARDDFARLENNHKALLTARKQELGDLKRKLAEAQQKTKQEFAKLTAEQKMLFEAAQAATKTSAQNQELEQEIRKLEKADAKPRLTPSPER